MKKLILLLLLLLPFSVSGNSIETFTVDDFFEEAHIGWNLGNSLDCSMDWNGQLNLNTETRWGNPMVTKELIDYVKAQGFNVIRIPVTWYYHTYKDNAGNYVIYEEWLNRVKEVVDYAYNNGLYVIINTHHDDKVLYVGETDSDKYEKIKSVAASFWSQIANKFKNYDEHLMFEAYNEIDNHQDSWVFGELAAEQVNELNQIFLDVVRETGGNNQYRLLLISPVIMKNTTQAINALEVPNDLYPNKIMLSVHLYSVTEDEITTSNFQRLANVAKNKGLRAIVTEFGNTTSYSPIEHRALSLSNYVARAYEQGIIGVIWDNGSDYALINRKNLSESNHELIDAVTKPTKYTNPNGHTTINQLDQFYYKRLTSQGAFDEVNLPNWWGSWTNQELIPIPDNMNYLTFSVYNNTDTPLLNLHGIFFFDENQEYISGVNSNYPGYDYTKFTIPSNAKYFRYSLYNAKVNTRLPYFESVVNDGLLYVSYGTYSINSLIGERVYFKEKPIIVPEEDNSNEVNNNEKEEYIEENPKTGIYNYGLLLALLIISFIYIFTLLRKKVLFRKYL